MSIKIKNIKIKGIRGVKSTLEFSLNGKSILLYGDNGSGKSSISDSIEWYYTDRVSHLSSNEIDLKDALRNSTLVDDEDSEISISFLKHTELDCSKFLINKQNKLIAEFSNTSDEFKNYINTSENENLLLRYQHLTGFIDNTKGEKLKYLSDIIGFSDLTKKKEVLKKVHNSLKSELKYQNFETQISTQKGIIIQKIGAVISQETNLFEEINEKIKHLKIGIEVTSTDDIDRVLAHIKKPVNKELVEELQFLGVVNEVLTNLKKEIAFIDKEYIKYFNEFSEIAKDVQSIMQTFLGELLEAGNLVLEKKYHSEKSCPLCLQPKDIETLQSEINKRLKEIGESSGKLKSFQNAKQLVNKIFLERAKRIDTIIRYNLFNDSKYEFIKTGVDKLKEKITRYTNASLEKVASGNKIPDASEIELSLVDFEFHPRITERIKQIQKILNNDNTLLYSNISASKDAFLKVQKLENQKAKLENQRNSLELIYNEFVKKQKEGLEDFISTFSGKINEYYQYMNPNEPFQEIKIVTIGDDDELNGLTVEYKYNGDWVSPPQKYFSESHLNCFGLSFFLASVEAFNEKNKFIILDDVISSFDSTHRKRFAELIFEKFSKYQIVLLTHEKEWFTNFVSPLAKKKGWLINEIKWTESKGTHLEEEPSDLRERIEINLADSEIDNLGNPIRRYLEHTLKDIALNIEAKLNFQYNNSNEHRMPYELIMGIKSEIKKHSPELKTKFPVIDRIESSSILGNILSHDNPFNPKIGDLKAFWNDILELEKIFICEQSDCKRPIVSLKNLDTVAKKIRCGCDHTKYDWK